MQEGTWITRRLRDWLFHMQGCELPGYQDYDLETAATVMSEVMKTLLEDPEFDYGGKWSMCPMYKAVQTGPVRVLDGRA